MNKEGEPTAEELANENLLKIMGEKCTDEQMNWLVWKCLGKRSCVCMGATTTTVQHSGLGGKGEEGEGGTYSFVACLSRLNFDHAFPWRRWEHSTYS